MTMRLDQRAACVDALITVMECCQIKSMNGVSSDIRGTALGLRALVAQPALAARHALDHPTSSVPWFILLELTVERTVES